MGIFNFFSKEKKETLDSGLSKTKENVFDKLTRAVAGKSRVDEEVLDNLEASLVTSDVGVETTLRIIERIEERVARDKYINTAELNVILKDEIVKLLAENETTTALDFAAELPAKPYVIMVVGVNGVGKTTTIGKLAKRLQGEGKKVMLAAGDTFRAAATEQLQIWGERNNIAVVAQGHGADSASVIFDAFESARAKGVDVLIADTAGRLHNKSHLMQELTKVKRVMQKIDATAPHEVMLVVDAGTGQNAINQVEMFDEAVGLTGITITKLDGTAKGGVLFNIASRTHVPIRFIGVGEKIDDLRPFSAKSFVAALFETDK